MRVLVLLLFPFLGLSQTDSVYIRFGDTWVMMARDDYNNAVSYFTKDFPTIAKEAREKTNGKLDMEDPGREYYPSLEYSALFPWGEILANGFGFAKNITDAEDYTPKDAFKIAKEIPPQYRKINRMLRRGKLKPSQYDDTEHMFNRVARSIAVRPVKAEK